MYALTIRQPWAYCITHGTKRVENRSWKPPSKIIGERIAIHTSQKLDKASLSAASDPTGYDLSPLVNSMLCGYVVGTAVVVGYLTRLNNKVRVFDVGSAHPACADRDNLMRWHIQGQYGWILHDVHALDKPDVKHFAIG